MIRAIKENPITSIISVLTIVSMIVGAAASLYTVYEKLDDFVTEGELERKSDTISVEILNVAIMRYEDDLMSLEIKIQIGTATDYDKAKKTNIDRRLAELKAKKLALETKVIHL